MRGLIRRGAQERMRGLMDAPQDAETRQEDRAISQEDRLLKLVSAGIALSSELSLDDLLSRLVETAAELTGARYAALGVLDPSGTALERFIMTGIDEEARRRIGDLPRGRGILGVLIRDAKSLRLSNLGDDPRSVGFPPGHPPMRSFLGTPIVMRGVAYGNLYLTEKSDGGGFTADDEQVAELLAGQAAAAIDNARLYQSATTWMRQLETLVDVSRKVAGELDIDLILETLCREICELIDAETALVAMADDSGGFRIPAIAGDDIERFANVRAPTKSMKAGRVMERGRAERIDSVVDDPEIDQRLARQLSIRSALMVPIQISGVPLGLLMAFNHVGADGRFSDGDLRLAELFAERAAQPIDLSQRVSREALSRALEGQEQERRRLGAELHDEAAQALALILMGIRSAEASKSEDERAAATAHLKEVAEATLGNVRRLSHQLRPPTLTSHGLASAISMVAEQITGPGLEVTTESTLRERLDPQVETSLFRMVQEALANVVRHAHASMASVLVARQERSVVVVVEDDGVGFDVEKVGVDCLGLVGMRERLELIGGVLEIESIPGTGTTVRARVPVRRRTSG